MSGHPAPGSLWRLTENAFGEYAEEILEYCNRMTYYDDTGSHDGYVVRVFAGAAKMVSESFLVTRHRFLSSCVPYRSEDCL